MCYFLYKIEFWFNAMTSTDCWDWSLSIDVVSAICMFEFWWQGVAWILLDNSNVYAVLCLQNMMWYFYWGGKIISPFWAQLSHVVLVRWHISCHNLTSPFFQNFKIRTPITHNHQFSQLPFLAINSQSLSLQWIFSKNIIHWQFSFYTTNSLNYSK